MIIILNLSDTILKHRIRCEYIKVIVNKQIFKLWGIDMRS